MFIYYYYYHPFVALYIYFIKHYTIVILCLQLSQKDQYVVSCVLRHIGGYAAKVMKL